MYVCMYIQFSLELHFQVGTNDLKNGWADEFLGRIFWYSTQLGADSRPIKQSIDLGKL